MNGNVLFCRFLNYLFSNFINIGTDQLLIYTVSPI